MSRSRLFALMVAAPMAFMLVACSGSDGPRRFGFPDPGGGGGGDGVVSVMAPAGATFFGFDVWLDYDAGVMTPTRPVAGAVQASGAAVGSSCQATEAATTVRFACAKATGMNGPTEIAVFPFSYDAAVPTAGDFAATCEFVDGNGQPVALTCTATFID